MSFDLNGKRKTPKQKPGASFNRRISIAKILREHDNGQVKMLKKYFIGEYNKGEYSKGYYGSLMFIINL